MPIRGFTHAAVPDRCDDPNEAGDRLSTTRRAMIMRQNTTLDVLIEQDGTRMKVLATLTPDTETGDPEGWAILYRMPDDSPGGRLDDARPYSVVSATGHRAHFMGWRKAGRRRLGIGIGTPPVEHV
jgi:hypothetical protein